MDLPQRCGCERLCVERLERLAEPCSQLGLDDPFDVVEGKGLDVVLQACESGEIRLREEIRAGRQQLSELDESRTELFEVLRQRFGIRAQVSVASGDIIATESHSPMLREQESEVLVPRCVSRLEQHVLSATRFHPGVQTEVSGR